MKLFRKPFTELLNEEEFLKDSTIRPAAASRRVALYWSLAVILVQGVLALASLFMPKCYVQHCLRYKKTNIDLILNFWLLSLGVNTLSPASNPLYVLHFLCGLDLFLLPGNDIFSILCLIQPPSLLSKSSALPL